MMNKDQIKNLLYGVLVGDALGVPFEFKSREEMNFHPATDMVGYGTHYQPEGTFSDDGSLTLCLADSLIKYDYNLEAIANNILQWFDQNLWTAHGEVFDIGIATREAILRLKRGVEPHLAGGNDEFSNGNGSLMRILPLLIITKDIHDIGERYKLIKEVSSITHRHIRSVIACFYYLEFALQLLSSDNLYEIYHATQKRVLNYLKSIAISDQEISNFRRLLFGDIFELDRNQISGSGYVLSTLEASIWCLFHSSDYKSAVLEAVNLGEDTDTTAAVTGGLAGIYYGYENIPKEWVEVIARKQDIDDLIDF